MTTVVRVYIHTHRPIVQATAAPTTPAPKLAVRLAFEHTSPLLEQVSVVIEAEAPAPVPLVSIPPFGHPPALLLPTFVVFTTSGPSGDDTELKLLVAVAVAVAVVVVIICATEIS